MRILPPFFVLFLTLCLPTLIAGQSIFKEVSEEVGTLVMGGQNIGVSICDFNNDYLQDLYVVSRVGPNHFYKNLGAGVFIEQAAEMGLDHHGHSRMAVWGDLNNDGWEDMYLGNLGQRNLLFQNNGDGTFTNVTLPANITNAGRVYSVNMTDVNNDGWLDIYVSNAQTDNVLYLNEGLSDLSFIDYTKEAGLKDTRHCMGAVFFDMDNDGDEDLYVTHDAGIPNTLFENDGTGHFTEIAQTAGVAYQGFGMGVDAGDLNNDGFFDLYVTNLYNNVLYINNGNQTFEDYTSRSNVGDIGMGWGASIFDYDNDGLNDIYVGNDSYFYPNPNILYDNKGDNQFSKVDTTANFSSMQGTYGVATGDLNNDGLLELVLANIGTKDHTQIFTNEMDPGYWIGFQLEGVTSNRSAIGARIEIIDNRDNLHIDQVMSGNGYAGQNTKRLHFGFGPIGGIKQIKVIWPSGQIQEWQGLELGKYYSVKEGEMPISLDFSISTSVETPPSDLTISLYPNPSQRYITLSVPKEISSTIQLSLTRNTGEIIANYRATDDRELTIDLEGRKGIFYLIINKEGAITVKKLIVL